MLGNMISKKAVSDAVRVICFSGGVVADSADVVALKAVPAVQLGVHS
jgi:hypothetical protein